ncbi:hypothetical protein [uncultured Ruegeria sp.]|uniref:hypothetical protein n=1 Tax=uncultured Ruegeria sp. TaxID=259304 RepID=UPI00262FCB96|nr:hypothetical protein [uncultured Ruegeria sp.]
MAGGGDKQTTVQKSDPWGPSKPYLKGAMRDAESLYESGGMSAQPYAGDRVANLSDATQQGMAGIMRAADDTSLIDGAGGALNRMMNPEAYGERLEGVKNNALGSAIPAAVSMFSGSGMANSGQAMDYVGRAATEAVAPYEYNAFNQAEGRAMQAAGMAPGIDAARYTPMQQMLGVGAIEQDQNQREIDADMAQHYEAGNKRANDLNAYTQMLLGYGGQGGTSTGTTSGGGAGAGDIIGGGLQGLAMTNLLFPAMFASDRRLKRDIVQIGETPGGNNLYAFKYRGDKTQRFGVMSDEVPHAVAFQVGGFDIVNYQEVA